ncbi:MAG: class E sortase [Acidimicrobiia bacterium]
MRLARVLGAVGRVLITAGVLILLFVAYQLWGTGIREAQSQDRLADDFAELLDRPDPTTSSTSTTSTTLDGSTTTSVATGPATGPVVVPPEGEAVARITIPRIEVDKIVVEGVSVADLKKGPGHYPETPLPGQAGNAAIAGHRTTYGAPFNRIDELVAGDEVVVETVQGRFRYLVREQLIVSPSQVEVLDQTGEDLLTLTACHPKYSARQRIVVVAELAPGQTPLPVVPADPGQAGDPAPVRPQLDDIDGESAAIWPALAWGGLAALVWLAAWLVGRRWRRWPAYLVGLPVFLVVLFFFFEEFSRLLPTSY